MNINELIFDPHGRLRSGFRAAAFIAVFVAAAIVLSVLTAVAANSLGAAFRGDSLTSNAVNYFPLIVAAVFGGWLCGKFFEKLPFRAFGIWFTKGWLRHVVAGSVIGCGVFAIAVAVAVIFGGLSFEMNADPVLWSVLSALGIFALGAAFEEVVFRGYILQTFVRSGWIWLGILLTAVPFGIVHLGNPNATVISTLNTVLAGIWFGIAYLRTRDLWLVWGLHTSWNWMQNSIFGIEVSGLNFTSSPLFREIDRGPEWLTGLNYGLEGGIGVMIALIAAIVITQYAPFIKADEEMLAINSEPAEKISPSGS
jgi:membrane protease YdiL (CAAX protease family)